MTAIEKFLTDLKDKSTSDDDLFRHVCEWTDKKIIRALVDVATAALQHRQTCSTCCGLDDAVDRFAAAVGHPIR